MNAHFSHVKVAVLAAASVILLAAPQLAAAQTGGDSQSVPYADSQRDRDTDYRTPPPPPAPPPPPTSAPAISYAPTSDSRYVPPSDPVSYRDAPHPQCRMIEDRAYYPDGTTESRTVQACRGLSGRWHIID